MLPGVVEFAFLGQCPAQQERAVEQLRPVVPRRPGSLHPLATGKQQGANSRPALAPGEQRSFDVSLPADAGTFAWRIVYCRNLLQPGSYSVEILSGTERLGG